jgi:hypothetical protein
VPVPARPSARIIAVALRNFMVLSMLMTHCTLRVVGIDG